jgi:hypothetical protein
MGALDADPLHERGDIIGKQFCRLGPCRLVRLACTAWVEGNAGEELGIVRDLESVASIVGGKVWNEDERLTGPLLLVIHSDVVHFDFRHISLPNEGASLDENRTRLYPFEDNEKTIPTILTTSQKLSTGAECDRVNFRRSVAKEIGKVCFRGRS